MRDFILKEESGQALVEYVVVLGGFVVVGFSVLNILGRAVGGSISESLRRAGKVEIVINRD